MVEIRIDPLVGSKICEVPVVKCEKCTFPWGQLMKPERCFPYFPAWVTYALPIRDMHGQKGKETLHCEGRTFLPGSEAIKFRRSRNTVWRHYTYSRHVGQRNLSNCIASISGLSHERRRILSPLTQVFKCCFCCLCYAQQKSLADTYVLRSTIYTSDVTAERASSCIPCML